VLLDMVKSGAVVLQLSYQTSPKGFFDRFRSGGDSDDDAAFGSSDERLLSLAAQFVRELSGRGFGRSSDSQSSFGPSLSYEDRIMISAEALLEEEEER
jgi:hypothetical protein